MDNNVGSSNKTEGLAQSQKTNKKNNQKTRIANICEIALPKLSSNTKTQKSYQLLQNFHSSCLGNQDQAQYERILDMETALSCLVYNIDRQNNDSSYEKDFRYDSSLKFINNKLESKKVQIEIAGDSRPFMRVKINNSSLDNDVINFLDLIVKDKRFFWGNLEIECTESLQGEDLTRFVDKYGKFVKGMVMKGDGVELNSLGFVKKNDIEEVVKKCPNLSKLKIVDNSLITSIPKSIEKLAYLEGLSISNCKNLSNLESNKKLKTFEVSKCDSLSRISGLKVLEALIVSDCKQLDQIRISDLNNLSISNCDKLSQMSLESIKNIKVQKCDNLRELDHIYGSKTLDVSECNNFGKLVYSDLENVKVSRCPLFGSIYELKDLKSLNVSDCCGAFIIQNCTTLGSLSGLNNIQDLQVLNCNELTEISNLSNVTYLSVTDCNNLAAISDLPNLISLSATDNKGLTTISKVQNIIVIRSSGNRQLETINLVRPSIVRCTNCPSFINLTISDPQDLTNLILEGCSNLTNLPGGFPRLRELNIIETGITEIPEVPQDCQVFRQRETNNSGSLNSSAAGNTSWALNIDVDELENNPKRYLLQLGNNYFLKEQPFPNVYYFKDGQPSRGIDAGGLRRDFISRLMENLFTSKKVSQNSEAVNSDGDGNKDNDDEKNKIAEPSIQTIPFAKSSGGFPLPQNDDKPDTITGLKTLAHLFCRCYPNDSFFKIGNVFGPEFFNAIAEFKDPDDPTEDELIRVYGILNGISKGAIDFATQKEGVTFDSLSPEDKYQVQFLINEEDPESVTTIDHDDLYTKIFEAAVNDQQFKGVLLIAQEMKKVLGNPGWADLCRKGPVVLQNRIQGELSEASLISKLEYKPQGKVSPQDVERTKKFLETWIHDHKDKLDELSRFVRVVTSNNTLGPNNIKVELYNRDKELIPVAHTCFFSIEIPVNYPDQAHFNRKFELLLTEALAGTGFQEA